MDTVLPATGLKKTILVAFNGSARLSINRGQMARQGAGRLELGNMAIFTGGCNIEANI